uniref:Uncharacterized protein n=1 Tax=Arundo donax TaxID=35708 RepID=A0A0A9HR95_ARUDO
MLNKLYALKTSAVPFRYSHKKSLTIAKPLHNHKWSKRYRGITIRQQSSSKSEKYKLDELTIH